MLRNAPFHRLTVEPTPNNGLQVVSQIMVDKIIVVRRDTCGAPIGKLDDTATLVLNRMLALVVGLAD